MTYRAKDDFDAPTMSPDGRPSGWRYIVGTWSGRLILVNAIFFFYVSYISDSLFMPSTQALLDVGAKAPTRLAAGEYWRLLSPMFIHIGLVHFIVNSYVLYVIGFQLERVLGGFWYLAIYLSAGIAGNIASAVFSVNMSAGASGAIFGLLGAGFYLERSVGRRIRAVTGRKPAQRAYAVTVALNLAFGFLVPFIDNAAHLGGLVAGVILTMAMLNLRPNSLLQYPRRGVGVALIALLVTVSLVGARLGTSASYILDRLATAAEGADSREDKIFYLSQALDIAPDNSRLRLARARQLFLLGEAKYAFFDVREAVRDPALASEVAKLADELEASGKVTEAWEVRRMLAHASPT